MSGGKTVTASKAKRAPKAGSRTKRSPSKSIATAAATATKLVPELDWLEIDQRFGYGAPKPDLRLVSDELPQVEPSFREQGLDGLRGFAIIAVVLHHCMLVIPALSDQYMNFVRPQAHHLAWLLAYTPLHLLWAGPEATYVFFIISGYVLASSFYRNRFAWPRFYLQRLVRLYLPAVVAVIFAFALLLMLGSTWPKGISDWLAWHAIHVNSKPVAIDAATIGTTVPWLNTPLWFARWSLLLALIMPGFIHGVLGSKRDPALKVIGFLILVGLGSGYSFWLMYPAMFGLGILLAQHRDRIFELGARFDSAHVLAKVGAGVCIVILLSASWLFVPQSNSFIVGLATSAETLGALLLVILFMATKLGRRVGSKPPARLLGKRSFSVFLIHEPIVVTVARLLGTTNGLLVLAIALPISLLAAEAFYRLIERPTHRLAQSMK
ncbi:MAG: acyltransferase family protein [Actinomycetota bacterium]